MLTTIELARRIKAAMDWREPRIPSALVARRCGVTPQAVNKWRTDGKVDLKRHLTSLSEVTQVPPMFYLEPEPGQTEETRDTWRKLTGWLSKAAVVLLMALPPLLPTNQAEAATLHNAASVYTLSRKWQALRRRIMEFLHFLTPCWTTG